MCELLGMSARHPTDVNHSLALLRPRGGEIGPHADGWGVAFYEGRAARVFKEPVPAAESRCLAFIAEYNYQSTLVIGHIRKANPPDIGRSSANTHPFSRELGGRAWVFAHNGKLPGLREDPRFSPGRFQPMGETDSEHAFCFLLDRIASAQRAMSLGSRSIRAASTSSHTASASRSDRRHAVDQPDRLPCPGGPGGTRPSRQSKTLHRERRSSCHRRGAEDPARPRYSNAASARWLFPTRNRGGSMVGSARLFKRIPPIRTA
jgi:predicted glutamine amidotransferase